MPFIYTISSFSAELVFLQKRPVRCGPEFITISCKNVWVKLTLSMCIDVCQNGKSICGTVNGRWYGGTSMVKKWIGKVLNKWIQVRRLIARIYSSPFNKSRFILLLIKTCKLSVINDDGSLFVTLGHNTLC